MAYLNLKDAPFHVTSGGILVGGGRGVQRHCVKEGFGPSGKRRCLKYTDGPCEMAGGVLVGGAHPSMGMRHCILEADGPSGKKRCKKFAAGPAPKPKCKPKSKKGGAYSGGAYSGGCHCCQGAMKVPKEARSGSAAQKKAAKKNPWLKFLKAYRAEAKRLGVQVDLKQAAAEYHSMRG